MYCFPRSSADSIAWGQGNVKKSRLNFKENCFDYQKNQRKLLFCKTP